MSLDLAQNEDQLNMPLIWNILMMQVISVWVVNSILIVYYESKENEQSMQVVVPMFVVLTLATVPTYFWLSDVRL